MSRMALGNLGVVQVIPHRAGDLIQIGDVEHAMKDGTIITDGRELHMTESDYEKLKASPDIAVIS